MLLKCEVVDGICAVTSRMCWSLMLPVVESPVEPLEGSVVRPSEADLHLASKCGQRKRAPLGWCSRVQIFECLEGGPEDPG